MQGQRASPVEAQPQQKGKRAPRAGEEGATAVPGSPSVVDVFCVHVPYGGPTKPMCTSRIPACVGNLRGGLVCAYVCFL